MNRGVPFRDAHGIIGQLVLFCLGREIAIDEVPLEELKKFSPVFAEDVYEAISLETCVNKRLTVGAPGKESDGACDCSGKGVSGKIGIDFLKRIA